MAADVERCRLCSVSLRTQGRLAHCHRIDRESLRSEIVMIFGEQLVHGSQLLISWRCRIGVQKVVRAIGSTLLTYFLFCACSLTYRPHHDHISIIYVV